MHENKAIPTSGFGESAKSDRLDSWKEIAKYLGRDVRTVQRWERRDGLPIHRLPHEAQGSVFAYRSEIDQWWSSRQQCNVQMPAGSSNAAGRPLFYRQWFLIAVTVIVALVLAGRILLRRSSFSAVPIPRQLTSTIS